MIKKSRLISTFLELAQIPGLSRKEKKIARMVAQKLRQLGAKVKFDRALAREGEVGNLIAYFPGSSDQSPLLLNAHLDTVGPVGEFSYQRRKNYLKSRGKSILGADDRAGVSVILEVLEHLKESKKPHPPLEIVFTVAEEIGLLGAKELDYSLLRAKYGIVLDSDHPCQLVIGAPEAYRLIFKIHGKSAHAGVSPEKGINAIQIASRAISRLKLGRIDSETTANIGIIKGGTATNIIPDYVEVRGEVRSHNRNKLKRQTEKIRETFHKAVAEAKKPGKEFAHLPKLEEEILFDYPLMRLSEDCFLIQLFKKAGEKLGEEIITKIGSGGSDANIFNQHGIETLIMGCGMEQVHTVQEQLNLDWFYLSARLLALVIELYSLESEDG